MLNGNGFGRRIRYPVETLAQPVDQRSEALELVAMQVLGEVRCQLACIRDRCQLTGELNELPVQLFRMCRERLVEVLHQGPRPVECLQHQQLAEL